MTILLAFDTATAACSVALSVEGELHHQLQVAPRRHGECLLPMIDALFKKVGCSLSDCDAIAFGNGPGSFMGLRIAAGVAQGLAYGAGIPVIPVSTLRALAQTAYWDTPCDSVLVGWDARMQQIYWGVYEIKEGMAKALMADQLSSPAEVSQHAAALKAGNAWSQYKDFLSDEIANLPDTQALCYPSAKAVAYIAAQSFANNETVSPEKAELSYLRNKVAEKPSR